MKNKLYIHQIVKMSIFNISILSLLLAISCSSGDSDSNSAPTNLNVVISVVGSNDNNPNGDGSGAIQIMASATNAIRYAFRFGTGDQIDSESGNIEHTFLQDGTNNHNITVWAYSESGAFVNESYSVDVYRSDEAFAKLVFSDEFENEGRPDDQKWHHQVIPPNNGSWHNDELQHYTDREENSYVNNGTLKIKAIKEQYSYNGSTKEYTSARM